MSRIPLDRRNASISFPAEMYSKIFDISTLTGRDISSVVCEILSKALDIPTVDTFIKDVDFNAIRKETTELTESFAKRKSEFYDFCVEQKKKNKIFNAKIYSEDVARNKLGTKVPMAELLAEMKKREKK